MKRRRIGDRTDLYVMVGVFCFCWAYMVWLFVRAAT